jgi:N-acylglucosamine 2-epimerase
MTPKPVSGPDVRPPRPAVAAAEAVHHGSSAVAATAGRGPAEAPGDAAALRDVYRHTLLDDVVPFWFPRSVDAEHGGFLTALDRDGALLDTDKSVWFQGRAAWMLLTLFNTVERRPEWLAWAESGLAFLEKHCVDGDGRLFFLVTREGVPLRKRRYAYSEAFGAIAHAAHARAAGDGRSAGRSRDLFERFVRWNFTPGLMPPKDTGARPSIGLAPRMIAIVTAQELRANLGDDAGLRAWIDRCIDEIGRLFWKPDLDCVLETVAPDGSLIDHFDGRTLNPGHAIEGAWFILHEARHRGDAAMRDLGLRMLDASWRRGWDGEHGGLFYFRDVHGKPVQEYWHDMKFWWPHNEAVIATLLAWRMTGDTKYAAWHRQVHDWAFAHFPDPEHGEWYGYLHRDGRVSVPLKGNHWKGFFHLPRMLWYGMKLLEEHT